jgi:hypothetical protein
MTLVQAQRQSHGGGSQDHQPLSHGTEFQSSSSPAPFRLALETN